MVVAAMTDGLFGTWLAQTEKLQIEAYNSNPRQLEGQDRIQYLTWNTLAGVDELMEMLKEISWKPWTVGEYVNEDAAAAEIVDLLHFAGNILLALHWDDDKLNAYYVRKMDKNRARMASGTYDGVTNKCSQCNRALDDEYVLCTTEVCAND